MDKLIKAKGYKTTTFEVESTYFTGFLVDIVESEEGVTAYLFHKNNPKKVAMFGACKGYPAYDNFKETVVEDIAYQVYKYIRENTHFEEEYQEWDAPCEEE